MIVALGPPFTQDDEGSFVIPDTGMATQPKRLIISGTNRGTLRGTSRLTIKDSYVDAAESPSTQPRQQPSIYLGPDESLTFFDRLQLVAKNRLSAVGNSRIQIVSPCGDSGTEVFSRNPPDATVTTSTTMVMAGYGGRITAGASGVVVISIQGDITNTSGTVGNGAAAQLAYGTGAPPLNGAALTGQTIGILIHNIWGSTTITTRSAFNAMAIVRGLTPGVTYWFDLQFEATGGGTAGLLNAYLLAYRL